MAWGDVFGELWFWALAAAFWARFAFNAFGAPRRVVAAAMKDTGAAAFAHDLVRYRLTRGDPTPPGLAPLRGPLLGAACAYLTFEAFRGDALSLALLTGVAPLAGVSLALESRIIVATARASEGRTGPDDDGALATFSDVLEQIWRVRLAAVCGAVFMTMTAAALTRGAGT